MFPLFHYQRTFVCNCLADVRFNHRGGYLWQVHGTESIWSVNRCEIGSSVVPHGEQERSTVSIRDLNRDVFTQTITSMFLYSHQATTSLHQLLLNLFHRIMTLDSVNADRCRMQPELINNVEMSVISEWPCTKRKITTYMKTLILWTYSNI